MSERVDHDGRRHERASRIGIDKRATLNASTARFEEPTAIQETNRQIGLHQCIAAPALGGVDPQLPIDRASVAKSEHHRTPSNLKSNSLLLLLTKNPQPILHSLGSEGDAVVSFWSFMFGLGCC